jgi:hypothetical protein
MTAELQTNQTSLYETDFLAWIETTAKQLRNRDYANLDWENLIEEVESMGRNERNRVRSNLIVLLMHLLKWQFQPERQSNSWKASIVEHRGRILDDLEDSPSFRPYLDQVLEKCYKRAVEQAIAETDLSPSTFPDECPYTIEQVMDSNFLPKP